MDPMSMMALLSAGSSLLGGGGGKTGDAGVFGSLFGGGGSSSGGPLASLGSLFATSGGSSSGGGPLSMLTGLSSSLKSLISGPGRGDARRAAARKIVDESALANIRAGVLRSIGQIRERDRTAVQIAAAAGGVLRADTAAAAAFRQVLDQGGRLGGFGSAAGPEANKLGDVLKWTFGLGTVPEKGSVNTDAILAALGGVGAYTAMPAYTAPMPAYTAPTPLGFARSYWSGTTYQPRF